MHKLHVPVLIVGAGPVGLAVAGELGWRGSRCLLIEKGTGEVVQPKMDLASVRTMEFCRRWGIVDRVEAAPYPRDYRQDYIYITGFDGFELGREAFPPKEEEPCPPQSPQKRERVPQHMFDPILRGFAEAFETVALRYLTELVDLKEEDDRVRALVRNVETGGTESVTADYLVAADGGASFVRNRLGIGTSGGKVLTYSTNILIRSSQLPQLHPFGPGYRYIFVGAEGTWLTITSVNGADIWRVQFIGAAEKAEIGPSEIAAGLERAAGRPFDYEIIDVMRWVRREMVADSYGTRRIFLSGDAAHLMSPTGAFGMNTGLQDAVDIGWKLDAVLKGWGGETLLASYEAERRPVALRNVAEASANLRRMLETRDRLPPAAVFEDGAAGEAARADYGGWYTEVLRREWHTLGINLGYRYDNSPVIVPDGTPAPPDEVMTYTQTARPGARAPHLWLPDGRSTLDLFGRGFVLLRIEAPDLDVSGLVAAARTAGVPLDVVDLKGTRLRAAYGAPLVLVRPDGHVAWRAETPPRAPADLLDMVRGASPNLARAAAAGLEVAR